MVGVHITVSQTILPGDESYEVARKVWNGSLDSRPAVVLRHAGGAAEIDSIRVTRELVVPLAVRGGATTSPATAHVPIGSCSTYGR